MASVSAVRGVDRQARHRGDAPIGDPPDGGVPVSVELDRARVPRGPVRPGHEERSVAGELRRSDEHHDERLVLARLVGDDAALDGRSRRGRSSEPDLEARSHPAWRGPCGSCSRLSSRRARGRAGSARTPPRGTRAASDAATATRQLAGRRRRAAASGLAPSISSRAVHHTIAELGRRRALAASMRTPPALRGARPARGGTPPHPRRCRRTSRSSASSSEPRTKSGSSARTSSHVVTPATPCPRTDSVSIVRRPPEPSLPQPEQRSPDPRLRGARRGSLRGRRSRRWSSRRGTRARGRRAAPGAATTSPAGRAR